MFVIQSPEAQKGKTIPWPVVVDVAEDGGKIKKYEFTGTFKRLNDDEREALAAEAKLAEPVDAEEAIKDSAERPNAWKERSVDNIMKVMVGWSGVVDEHKAPIEFTRDNLLVAARGQNGMGILRAINLALSEINTGSRAKN